MLRALFFDFNGVILDDEEYHYSSLKDVLKEEGVLITREMYYRDCLGFGDVECFQWGLKTQAAIDRAGGMNHLLNRKSAYYENLLEREARFFPGVCELMREAGDRYPMAVASMALRREIDLALATAGLTDLVSVIVSAGDVPRPKPAPDVYEKALLQINQSGDGETDAPPILPAECMVIEDSVPGIRSARAAGMRVVGVAHTVPLEELNDAHHAIPSLRDVRVSLLEGFMEKEPFFS